tara:strand:+ start:4255 stop:4764 length:510 start_codon:yes stop_codon:yes gene_type:complete
MKNKKLKLYKTIILFVLLSSLFSQIVNSKSAAIKSIEYITGEDYVVGSDGVPRMTLNIWGHVRNPGTYLMYDGIDILTALSIAGGPMKGAKTNSIKIISQDRNDDGSYQVKIIDLDKLIEEGKILDVELGPHDTIHIDENFGSYILSRGNVVNVLIQITNLLLIASGNR